MPHLNQQNSPLKMSINQIIPTVSGVPIAFIGEHISKIMGTSQKAMLFIALDEARAEHIAQSIRFFAPHIPILRFSAWDCLSYDRISPNATVSATRMAILYRLAHLKNRSFIVIATVASVTQYLPAPDYIKKAGFSGKIGSRINEAELKAYFARMGYTPTPTVTEASEFAIRGGLIDVFPPGAKAPLRMDLFGDILDGLRRFDPITQKTIAKLEKFTLTPASEVILDEEAIANFRKNYRAQFGAASRDDPLYEAVSAGRRHQGMEHWLPFFQEKLASLFDYMPNAYIYCDEGMKDAHEARFEAVSAQYHARLDALSHKSNVSTVYKPVPPEELYISPDKIKEYYQNFETIKQIKELPLPVGLHVTDAGGRIGRNFAPERQKEGGNIFEALSHYILSKQKSKTVILTSFSSGARERLQGLLADQGVTATKFISNHSEISDKNLIYLAIWAVEQGFETNDEIYISEQDVLGERLTQKTPKKKRAENFITEAASLALDDLVVHIEHGIGRYKGIETVTALNVPHDCILLEYAGSDRLYLPVENIDLLSRYGHEEGLLDRLGGGAWQAKKAKLKERIKDMADRLIKIAAERMLRKGHIIEPIEGEWDRFCAGFPYTETDDQLAAIQEVIEDLASGTPMDRLICGDVGFGKTEVALRAAYLAASTGSQVAVIAPTTLLARQHFRSFEERFKNTGVIVKPLSRFVSASEAKLTRESLKEGRVDIIIGTHAVLSKQVDFKNLGLVIIDEEQRFGVQHKERLKQLKSDIHVLTLTATPIPRTLQLSLSGVRSLSIISTPPVDRLSIRTYVAEFDTVMIREALLREHHRGGQSFIVVPRIADLPDLEHFLQSELPDIPYLVAHGQMPSGELDKRMNAFYDGKYGILLATTIVESGLDIPAANTMIVWKADKFGLAQLYQIRGRVGRSKTRAYAYLTTKPRTPITKQAAKRLKVLGAIDTLGAGFTLASQDLDLRGSGNILGEEQSGHVREVGFELYQNMLEEAIAKMKTGVAIEELDIDEKWSPKINLGVPVMIPEEYVQDLDVRLGLYRRLSHLSKKVEFEGFAAEMIDRFGPLPEMVENLMKIVRIKALCRVANIEKLDAGSKGAVIQFYKHKFPRPEGLVDYIQHSNQTAQIKENKLVIKRSWSDGQAVMQGAEKIATELVKAAQGG